MSTHFCDPLLFFSPLQPFCPRSPWPKWWTVFVDISRFVLLFPTFLQLKGLSSFSSIRRALGGGGTTAMHYGRGVLSEEEQTSAALFPLIARIASWVSPWLSWTLAPWQPWLSLKDIWLDRKRQISNLRYMNTLNWIIISHLLLNVHQPGQ